MSSPVSTSVSFPFSKGGGDARLELYNGGGFVGINALPLILLDTIPGNQRTLYASVGTIEDTGKKTTKHENSNYSQMNGVQEIDVPAGATYEIKLAFNELGQVVTPIETHRVGTKVFFNVKFWGMVFISDYYREGSLLRYKPRIIGGGGSAVVVSYGVVACYKEGHLAVCEVTPPTSFNGHDELEVYRVESKILINKEGEWELPSGWPDNPSYPNGAAPPKPRIGVVSTRVHEVGMVSKQGLFWSREFSVMPQRPYFGDGTYKPPTEIVKGSGFSKLSEEMQVAAMEIMQSRGKGAYL